MRFYNGSISINDFENMPFWKIFQLNEIAVRIDKEERTVES